MVYAPPDEASHEAASIIATAIGAKKKIIDDLAEPALGLLEGLHEMEFEERFPKRYKQWKDDPLSLAPSEGESAVDAQTRIAEAFIRVVRKSRTKEVAFVLRPFALGVIRCGLSGLGGKHMHELIRNRPTVERYALALELLDDWEKSLPPRAASV